MYGDDFKIWNFFGISFESFVSWFCSVYIEE